LPQSTAGAGSSTVGERVSDGAVVGPGDGVTNGVPEGSVGKGVSMTSKVLLGLAWIGFGLIVEVSMESV
jgi:hypothetical protein